MSRRRAAPLAERGEFLHSEFARERKHRIEHTAHMSGIQEETVTSIPERIFRIIDKVFGKQHIDEVRSTHCTTRMP